jgi:hypothetical protein
MLDVDVLCPFESGPVVGLAQQVGDAAHVGRQSLGIPGQARDVLDDPPDRGATEMTQHLLRGDGADQARVEQVVLRGALDPVLESGRRSARP